MTQRSSYKSVRQTTVQSNAWNVVLVFFAVFCALVATAGYFGWRYYTNATIPVETTLALKYVDTGVLLRPPGRSTSQDLTMPAVPPQSCPTDDLKYCDFFTEGQRLIGQRDAGYGPVAALKLPDQSLINLHTQPSGFDLTLKKYQISRWTRDRQDVVIEQRAGYARYDLAENQTVKQATFKVVVSGVTINLALGGSYSIDVPRTESGKPRGRLITDTPLLVEVAVRRGSAVVESLATTLVMRPNDKVQVAADGTFVNNDDTPFQPAEWELIADGDFTRYTTAQYNTARDELDAATTWNVRSYSDGTVVPGEFSIVTYPQMVYGKFVRAVGDGKQYNTGIDNLIGADVSEYTKSLRFHAEVIVLAQSITDTGELGTECPIWVTLNYQLRSPTDGPQSYQMCAFINSENSSFVNDGSTNYQPVVPFTSNTIDFDLRKLPAAIKDAWYISSIRVEARGHDYDSRIAHISLIGK